MNSLLLLLCLLVLSCTLYVVWTFLALLLRQARSPLRYLPGPPSPSFFMGNLREMHDAENTNLVGQWEHAYGSTFIYRGFIGGCRLMTTDPVAVTHILSRGYEYPKPDFVRDALASMAAGHDGLVVVEGDDHRRQRKILNPAFTSSHIKSLSPVFWDKATQLRDIWLSIVDSTTHLRPEASPVDPFQAAASGSTSSGACRWIPNPFSSFVSSKMVRRRVEDAPGTLPALEADATYNNHGVKVDVLAWFARATLDVIGEAGFGYTFDSLGSLINGTGQNELAQAFGVIFSAARKFRVMTILQIWFPVLRIFRRNSATEDAATRTMRRIGSYLIDERLQRLSPITITTSFKEKTGVVAETEGRDLLSLLIRSSVAADPSQQLSKHEILCQISTFLAAGHETTASALTWTFYALSRAPHVQNKLRNALHDLHIPSSPMPSAENFQCIFSEPYLDACVRESLRLHAPATSTMRAAGNDDIIPVSRPYRDKTGQLRDYIQVKKGDIITIPIQAMNKNKDIWGEDADEFVPERWLDDNSIQDRERVLKGLWGGILTFGSGHVVNGNRSCIGYRFAINEIKILLYILLAELEFSMDSSIDIEKKVNVVTRPCVKSEPHMGNQMPLRLRRVRR